MTRLRLALVVLALAAPLAAAPPKDSCVDCHSVLEGRLQAPVAAFAKDVHAMHGFSCADCHGGDRTAGDPETAMSRAHGFLGKPARTAVPKLCARCHSDANLIHRFRPQQRVDQYVLYETSVHGKRMAAGDDAAANCVDCHGVHDIREVKDPLSPVYPLRQPETCARCHASAAHMAKYKIPTNQYEDYLKSVHWDALSKRGDLAAPTCASCHGNHGATPPQVSSVAEVCGTCHALMEDLYNHSPHQPVFAAMGEGGCVVCHGNHNIAMPSPAMLAGPNAVCTQCHDADSAGGKAAIQMAGLITGLDGALKTDAILRRAARSGMEVSEALLRQREAQEDLVKARVAVHAFNVAAVAKPVQAGLAVAAGTHRAGEDALQERNNRRVGLAIALVAILITMAGLRLALRAVERAGPAAAGIKR